METCTNVVKLTLNLQKAYRYDQANIQLRDSWVSVDLIFSTTANRLLIGARKNFGVFLPNQKAERRRPFGTGLVRHCPQGLFSPFFTFLRAIFFRPFRLSLAPLSASGSPRMSGEKRWLLVLRVRELILLG